MRASSATRASSSSSVAPARVRPFAFGLRRPRRARRRTPRPAEGASHRTLGVDLPARRALDPTADPASPPIPASTSSNTSVGGASDSTTRSASIARESSPPDAALASGRAGSPGLGARRKVTSSAPSSDRSAAARPRPRTSAFGSASSAELLGHRVGERSGRGAAGRRERRRGALVAPATRGRAARLPARRPAASCGLELGDPGTRPRPRTRCTSASVGAVLARQLAQPRASRLHLGQPLGIDDDRLERRRAPRARLPRSRPAARCSRSASVGERRASGERADRAARPRPRPAPSSASYAAASASRCASASARIASSAASARPRRAPVIVGRRRSRSSW